MGWLSMIASDPRRSIRLLFWYWLLSAAAFGLYVVAVGAGTASDLSQMLEDPLIALSTAHAFTTVLMAGLLHWVGPYAPWLRPFSIFAILQQLILANLIGAGLAVLVFLSSAHARPRPAEGEGAGAGPHPALLGAAAVLLGLVSLILLVAQIGQLFSHL